MLFELIKKTTGPLNGCLVIGVFNDTDILQTPHSFDPKLTQCITRLSEKLTKTGESAWMEEINNHSLLVIQCGKSNAFNTRQLTKCISNITTNLIGNRVHTATISLPQIKTQSANWQLQQMILQCDAAFYQLLDYKSKDKESHPIENISFIHPQASAVTVSEAQAIAQGIRLTKTLADMPANHCTPTYLGVQALKLAKECKCIKTKIMREKNIEKMKMGAFLSVAKGSDEPPVFIEIQYTGNGNAPPIVLVGKGVTFDSGGISIKPSAGMEEMKYDMGGAASVLGTLKACALLDLPVNVVGLIPATENMPSSKATKPGDIVTSMSGQTIEVINTDAEGRLILADALTYAERFKPEFVIDIATLTGAVIVALGHEATGLMTPDDALAASIIKSSKKANDFTWQLPLDDVYQADIDSPIADIQNATNSRAAGSITAGCFLSRFTKNYRWAHLDIAGSAWVSGKNRHATGRPVATLVQILRDAADAR